MINPRPTSDEYTNDERAEDYGRFICTRADQSCDPYGHSNVKTLKNDWSEYKTQYNQMNKLAEGRFWIANADESSKSYLEKGASVYDYIYGKYSPSYSSDFEVFANRHPAVMAALRFQFTLFDGSVESNNTLLIILYY